MTRYKWIVFSLALAMVLGGGGAAAAVAMTGGDGEVPSQTRLQGNPPPEEPPGSLPPIRSDEGIDPTVCNRVHNIDACGDDGSNPDGEPGLLVTTPTDCIAFDDSGQVPIGHHAPSVVIDRTPEPDEVVVGDGIERVLTPAPIESVSIIVLESFPPQYQVQIAYGLPNSCTAPGSTDLDRDGNTITITVTMQVPADDGLVRAQVYRTVDTTVGLGSDFESGETYKVVVNDVTKTFIAQ